MPSLTVECSERNLTTLEFLQRRLPAAPRAFLRQLLKKGKVIDSTGPLAEDRPLAAGTTIHLPDSGRVHELLGVSPPVSARVRILFESRELLIVDKPAGLAVHAGVGHRQDNLTARLKALLAERGDRFMIAPVHRLDLGTSGPVLFGKGKKACGALGRLFMHGAVDKRYLALVAGQTADCGKLQNAVPAKGKVKDALTSFRTIERADNASLLELTLHSGRQHQIRRQLAECGHPLYGDRRYGGPGTSGLSRTFLHCTHLAFVDPYTADTIVVDSPLPAALDKVLDRVLRRPVAESAPEDER